MKKIITAIFAIAGVLSLQAQNLTEAQKAALEAAKTMGNAGAQNEVVQAPKLWDLSLKATVNFGQTAFSNWAAGGYNSYSLKSYVDSRANYKTQDSKMFWNNRLQLDYGLLYSADKPLIQKSDDRIYLESKWGYKMVEKLYFSAEFSFKSQFANGWKYNTPETQKDPTTGEVIEPARKDWEAARVLKSGPLSPGYFNLALGIDWTPTNWLTVNVAPLTGSVVTVLEQSLRSSYQMPEKGKDASGNVIYGAARFDFGAQIKTDVKLKVNDNFSYNTQLVLFSNYLNNPLNLRVNWDNRFDWKLAKFFSLCVTTNLIYDDTVLIDGRQRVQFMESLTFGFVYTIAGKK